MKRISGAIVAAAMLAGVPAQAQQAGDIMVRLRAITVAPTNKDNGAVLPSLPAASVTVGDAWVPEVDLTYFLTPNVAVETICCIARHSVYGTGAIAGLGKIGKTNVTPFTLNLQYHFGGNGGVKPYVGAGASWAIFYGESETASLRGALGNVSLDVRNKFGFDLQAGIDVPLSGNWYLNADFKYYFLKPTAQLSGGALAAPQSVKIGLNPIVAGVGIGYRF